MRDFTIDLIWTKIQIAVAALGGWLGYFLGGVDGLLIALIIFMALDYITGLMCAIPSRRNWSAPIAGRITGGAVIRASSPGHAPPS